MHNEKIANYELNNYKYIKFWEGRQYEHEAEVNLLRKLIQKFAPKLPNMRVLDIGGAYGRLAPLFAHTARETILADYSTHELKMGMARLHKTYGNKVKYLALNAYNIPLKEDSVDMIISVRVMHHLKDVKQVFSEVNRILSPGGIAIIEFANKNNLNALLRQLKQKNLRKYLSEGISRVGHQQESAQGIEYGQESIMYNFSKKYIRENALSAGLEIKGMYACSFLRLGFLKKYVPNSVLLSIEKLMQVILKRSKLTPSIFCVFKKKGESKDFAGEINSSLICPNCGSNVYLLESKFVCKNNHNYPQAIQGIIDLREPRPEEVDY